MESDLRHVENSRLEELVSDRSNLDVFETVFLTHELAKINGIDLKTLPKGKPRHLSIKEVRRYAVDVKNRVDSFLELEGMDMPWIRYYNLLEERLFKKFVSCSRYFDNVNLITLQNRKDQYYILPAVGHEYAHHTQDKLISGLRYMGDKRDGHSYFMEGHAIGVERELARQYTLLTGDRSFWDLARKNSVYSLATVYAWLCERYGEQERWRETILKLEPERADDQSILKLIPTKHNLGNAAFYLAERKHGTGIYAAALRGEFGFLTA